MKKSGRERNLLDFQQNKIVFFPLVIHHVYSKRQVKINV